MDIKQGILWLILTTFLESRNQPDIGQKNVVKVILNRAQKNNLSIMNTVLARNQFSCYNNSLSETFNALIKDYQYIIPVTKNVNQAIYEWKNGSNLSGATHYYSPKAMIPLGKIPSWTKAMHIVKKDKKHIFLVEL